MTGVFPSAAKPPIADKSRGSLSTIRVRLAAALAAALLPVLILGIVQSAIAFNRERVTLRQNLGFAAERSAATARSRMEGAGILLQTLAPGSIGYQCQDRLAEVARRIPGYANLVRFDRRGRVACAARTRRRNAGRHGRAPVCTVCRNA